MDPLKQNLRDELNATHQARFVVGPVRSSTGVTVRWLLAASLEPSAEGPTLRIGLTENARWVLVTADGSVADVEASENYLPFFPLLEMSVDEARGRLELELKKHGLNDKWLDLFPFEEITAAALMGRESWADLGLKWAETLGPSQLLCATLDMLRSTGHTQGQRHQAARILSAWRRRSQGDHQGR